MRLIQALSSRIALPIVAIRGINATNSGSCWEAGARGIAVVSALLDAADPAGVAAALFPPAVSAARTEGLSPGRAAADAGA